MKKVKQAIVTSIAAGLCIMAFLAFKSRTADDKFIMVRSFEPLDGRMSSYLIVTDGEKTVKRIDLETTKNKNVEENAMKVVAILNELKSQGYKLVSMTGIIDAYGITTYVLEKN